MSKRVAIVTGGTRGIGRAISKGLIAEGCQVAAIYAGNDKAAKLFEAELGGKAYKLDITNFDACQKTVAKIEKEMGPIDILVNNAGITKDGMMHKMSFEQWDDVLRTNLYSCFNMCRAVVPGMRARTYGRIVNISSINGQKGQLGQTNYSAAKAGMIGFTKSLALENANKKITVNSVCPGYIETDMTDQISHDILEAIVKGIPAGRMGKPEEVADVVCYLASERAAFITGSIMAVNGGQYMA